MVLFYIRRKDRPENTLEKGLQKMGSLSGYLLGHEAFSEGSPCIGTHIFAPEFIDGIRISAEETPGIAGNLFRDYPQVAFLYLQNLPYAVITSSCFCIGRSYSRSSHRMAKASARVTLPPCRSIR